VRGLEGQMNRDRYILLMGALLLASCTFFRPGSPARPVRLDKAAAEKVIGEIEKERAHNKEWLRSSPMSYLAAVDRIDFNEKKR